ncbi:MAG: divalent-cation tolerance protein CutA [bacterium]
METNIPDSKLIVFCTVKDLDEAATIAKILVKEKLAACVNIVPSIRSIYRWKGKINDESEVLMMIKTSKKLYYDLKSQIRAVHSYDVPEIVAFKPAEISVDFEKWWGDQLAD